MVVSSSNGTVYIKGVKDFDTDHIFDCGQCFRWERNDDGSYTGIAFGKIARVAYDKEESLLMIHGSTEKDFEEIWRDYLDLNRDYSEIKETLAARDPVIKEAINFGQGIRILNQEKWETLISFIISQNNNIPRIKKCINSLAETLGEYVGDFEGRSWYSLPTAEVLAKATVEDLAPCRLGYRAKYLIDTAGKVCAEGIESLEKLSGCELSAEETCEALKTYSGVGPKVANCIALFAMRKFNCFPIDVWVRKVMNTMYGIDENDMKKMADFAAENFGELGGIAQQYLFYYITHEKK
ncbi:MAG: DNA glycosylase [Bacillota bacterium]|nr:DNA glycosylase [Bacillota bacterium]